jgi:hypothetical protein
MSAEPRRLFVLQIFAARAAAELERREGTNDAQDHLKQSPLYRNTETRRQAG